VLAHGVLTGDVDTGHEVAVVNLERGYEVHNFRGDPPPCPSLYGGEYILLGGRDFVKGLIG
jgi:hypothetical protein